MIYTELTRLAINVAFEAHKNQRDRSGLPYITHPLHVAESMTSEDACVAALLHDVIEDTDMTLKDLEKLGFTKKQLSAVDLLTRREGEDYFDYVKKIADNDIATEVKLSDLAHNSDITRINNPSEKDIKRLEKYHHAKMILLSRMGNGCEKKIDMIKE